MFCTSFYVRRLWNWNFLCYCTFILYQTCIWSFTSTINFQFSCLRTKCLKFLRLKDSSSLSFKCWKQFPTVNTFATDDVRKNFNNGGRQWIQFALGSFSKSVTPLSTHSLLDSSLFLSLFFFESKTFPTESHKTENAFHLKR